MLLFVSLLLCLSGCWNSREVNDLAIAVALGIDKYGDDSYRVSVQVLNPGEVSTSSTSGYDTPVTTYTATGRIIFEALRKLTQQLPNKIYLAHIRMIIIGEEVAREGIYKPIDFLSRDPEMRTDFYVVVSKGNTANEILNVLTSYEKIPANKLFDSLNSSSENWAATGKIRLNELMDDLVKEGIHPILTAIKIIGDPEAGEFTDNVLTTAPDAILSYDGMGAFRANKLVGWLNVDESKGLNYVKGNVKNTVIVSDMDDGQVGIELTDANSEIIPHYTHGDPTIEVKITGVANIADVNTKLDLMTEHIFSELEDKTNNNIKEKITQAIDKAQNEFESDIFGFGDQIHKTDPKNWEKIKNKWSEIFPKIPINVTVDIQLKRAGTIKDPFYQEIPSKESS